MMSDEQVVSKEPAVQVGVQEEPAADCGVTPETALLVFDAAEAQAWLTRAYMRRVEVFRSIRFEAEEMPEEHFGWLLQMAVAGLLPVYLNAETGEECPGVLFVPAKFANQPELSGLQRGKKHGKYVAFHKQVGFSRGK
jgi:hypothetical protein